MSPAKKTLTSLVDETLAEHEKPDTPKKSEEKAKKTKVTKKTASKKSEEVAEKPAEEAPVSVMETLLESDPTEIPKVGDVIQGTVTEVGSNTAIIDLGPIGSGVVLGKEMRDGLSGGAKMKPGDIVSATVIDLENEDGHIELSIRAASYEKSWEDIELKLENHEVVSTKVLDANKGGLMVEINGISGFLPVSQLASEHYPRVEDGDKNKILEILKHLVGEEMRVRILDGNRAAEKLIVSEKAAQSEKEREIISFLSAGDVISGEVSGVVDFGAFVKFPVPGREKERLEGLVHISELAWQLIDDPREIVKTGDHVDAKVIGIEDTRISLSIKALKEDPWLHAADRYKVGDSVEGKVDKVNHFGAFVYLDKDIHGLAYVSEFQNVYPGRKMEEVFHIGENYKWKILSMDPKSHRLGLLPIKK